MSDTGQKDKGYPKTDLDDRDFDIVLLYGGSGRFACITPLGATYEVYAIEVPKHLIFNRRLLLQNITLGFDPHTDAGADPDCPNTPGSRVPWYLSFSADGVLTEDEMAQGVEFNQAPPFDIEVQANSLPQPTDAGWDNKIYVHLYWGNASYVSYGLPTLQLVKHDYDIKI